MVDANSVDSKMAWHSSGYQQQMFALVITIFCFALPWRGLGWAYAGATAV